MQDAAGMDAREQEKQELVQLILSFAREMNDLQNTLYPQLDRPGTDNKLIFRQYRAQADQVYARYLTQRKRGCYYAMSSPPFFDGVTERAEFAVEEVKARRAVEVLTREGMLDFRFSLVCREGRWLIDSFKQRYRSQDRSTVYAWQYGNF